MHTAHIVIIDEKKIVFEETIDPKEVTLIAHALLYYWARHNCEDCPASICCEVHDSCPDIGLDLFNVIGIASVADDIRKRGKIAVEEAIDRREI